MQYVLTMINSLIIPGTKHQFVNSQNHDLVNNIIKLNYMEFKVKRYDHYTTELMKNSIECRELNLNVGFQAFYLISKCFNNNYVDNRNFVQRIDSESLIEYYWRLLKGSYHHLKCAKGYTKAQKELKLKEYQEDEELKVESSLFFDGYTSSIEIVLTDGSTVTKFFPILPCFMSFSQVEKDEFWNSANLDNSKTCVDSLMEFSAGKIDELFAQQKVQDWWFTLRDAAKKANWLTDIT